MAEGGHRTRRHGTIDPYSSGSVRFGRIATGPDVAATGQEQETRSFEKTGSLQHSTCWQPAQRACVGIRGLTSPARPITWQAADVSPRFLRSPTSPSRGHRYLHNFTLRSLREGREERAGSGGPWHMQITKFIPAGPLLAEARLSQGRVNATETKCGDIVIPAATSLHLRITAAFNSRPRPRTSFSTSPDCVTYVLPPRRSRPNGLRQTAHGRSGLIYA